MNTVVAIKGTNGSGKSTVVRELLARFEKQANLRVNGKEAGYRCKYEDGSLFVLGKYKTAACGGLAIWVTQRGRGGIVQKPHDASECEDGDFWAFGLTRVDQGYELVEVARVRNAFDEHGNPYELGRETFRS